jgi:hypothetical protein
VYSFPALATVMGVIPSASTTAKQTQGFQETGSVPADLYKDIFGKESDKFLEQYARFAKTGGNKKRVRHARQMSRLIVKKCHGRCCIQFWRSLKGRSYLLIGTTTGRLVIVKCEEGNYGNLALILKISPSKAVLKMKVVNDISARRHRNFLFLYTSDMSQNTPAAQMFYMYLYKDMLQKTNVYRLLLDQIFFSGCDVVVSAKPKINQEEYSVIFERDRYEDADNVVQFDFSPQILMEGSTKSMDRRGRPKKYFSVQSLGPSKGKCLALQSNKQESLLLYPIDELKSTEYPLFEFSIPRKNSENDKEEKNTLMVSMYSSLMHMGDLSKSGEKCPREEIGKLQTFAISSKEIEFGAPQTSPSKKNDNSVSFVTLIDYAPWCNVYSEDVVLEGIVIVTKDSIYEMRPKSIRSMEEMFYRLVEAGEENGKDGFLAAEIFAQSLGLNILALYKQAADKK